MTAPAMLPLIAKRDERATFAVYDGRRVPVGGFLEDVQVLAAGLPARAHVLNLCADRYRFVVGFAAALVRGQISLLPPDHSPVSVARLAADYPQVYCLADDTLPIAPPGLEIVACAVRGGADAAGAFRAAPSIAAGQTAAIAFTSGSTGAPVPHPKTWGMLVAGAKAELARLRIDVAQGMHLVGTVPPQHMYGLESTVMLGLQGGLTLHAGRPFYAVDVCDSLASLPRPRMLVTTPFHLRALFAEVAAPPAADLVLCATAPLQPGLAADAELRLRAPLYEIYGCTESGQIASRRPAQDARWRPLKGVVLSGDGDAASVRGCGHAAPHLLNDVIERLPGGTFRLLGRKSDMVNIAGKRTSLAHLNHHLNAIEGVRDGVFINSTNDADHASERLVAYVVPARNWSAADILRALRDRIDPAFLPRPLHLVDALPRNPTGKLSMRALASMTLPATDPSVEFQ